MIEGPEPRKTALAKQVVTERCVVSTQVVNEVCVNLLRKAKRSEAEIREIICSFCSQHVVIDVDPDLLLDASELRTRYGFSYWDSVVVAAALSAGATVLVSEDMHDGLVVLERLRIVNPFRLLSTN